MDNMNPPPGQGPQDPPPAEPFRFTPGWPQQPAGYGPPSWGSPPPGGPGPYQASPGPRRGGRGPRRPAQRGRLLRWAAGIAAVALLAAGGTMAGLKLAGHSAPANTATAAALNTALGSAASPAGRRCQVTATRSASGSSARGSSGARHCRRTRLLRLVRGMDGEVAFHTKQGTVTLAFERGTVESASGGHLIVRTVSGTTWTWDLAADSVIRSHGQKVAASALTGGTRVFVAGQVSGSARDARLVLVRGAKGSGSRGSAAARSPAASSAA